MKKLFTMVLLLGLGLVTSTAHAQYSQGSLTGNLGIGFGLIGYGFGSYGSYSGFLPITANVEYSLDERFAVGPYLGYYGRSYKWGSGYKDKFTVFSFGGRGTFHATEQINEWFDSSIDSDKWDIYASLILGYEVLSWSYDEEGWGGIEPDYSTGGVIFGPVIGARYYFNESIGAYFEGGRGSFSVATLGITASLK